MVGFTRVYHVCQATRRARGSGDQWFYSYVACQAPRATTQPLSLTATATSQPPLAVAQLPRPTAACPNPNHPAPQNTWGEDDDCPAGLPGVESAPGGEVVEGGREGVLAQDKEKEKELRWGRWQ